MNNENFITNVQSYGNILGVFTISEVNTQKKRKIDQKTADRKAALDDIKAKYVPMQYAIRPGLASRGSHLFTVNLQLKTSRPLALRRIFEYNKSGVFILDCI